MATQVGNLVVKSVAASAGIRTTTLSISSNNAEHLIEVENLSWIVYEASVIGQIQGGRRYLTYPGNATFSPSLNFIVPMYSKAIHAEDLVFSGRTGSESLCCHQLSQRIQGASGHLLPTPMAECDRVLITL